MVHFLKDGKFNVGYIAHPAYVSDEELEAITAPLSITAAGKFPGFSFSSFAICGSHSLLSHTEIDDIFTAPLRHKSESILAKIGVPYQINLFSGVVHGFAERGDLGVPNTKFAKEQAFQQAVAWFQHHL